MTRKRTFYAIYRHSREYIAQKINGLPINEKEKLVDRIMIQLILLWYLQERKFLNEDSNYLVHKYLLASKKGESFYNMFLSLLFRMKGDVYLFRKCSEYGKIPVIGPVVILDEWARTIDIPNECFYTDKKTHTGFVPLLNILERLPRVDLYLIGEIYERSIEKRQRKNQGSYYTPQEITKYICDHTIYPYLLEEIKRTQGVSYNSVEEIFSSNYMKVKNSIGEYMSNMRILDPSVGAGNFLESALDTLIRIYMHVNDLPGKPWLMDDPRGMAIYHSIIKNLYGVDIDEFASKITTARLVLRILPYLKEGAPYFEIKPNIRTGNSLIGFITFSGSTKEELDREYAQRYNLALSELQEYRPFHWFFEFRDVEKFDIIIGNPPYGTCRNSRLKNIFRKELGVEDIFDMAFLFLKRMELLLSDRGIIGFVLPKRLNFTLKWRPARVFMLRSLKLARILDCKRAFGDAQIEVCAYILHKTTPKWIIMETIDGKRQRVLFEDMERWHAMTDCLVMFPDHVFREILNNPHNRFGVIRGIRDRGDVEYTNGTIPVITSRNIGPYVFINGTRKGRISKKSRIFRYFNSVLPIVPNLTSHLRCALKPSGYITSGSAAIVITQEEKDNMALLLALLNSEIIKRYLENYIFANSSLTRNFEGSVTNAIPLPVNIPPHVKNAIEKLVIALMIYLANKSEQNWKRLSELASASRIKKALDKIIEALLLGHPIPKVKANLAFLPGWREFIEIYPDLEKFKPLYKLVEKLEKEIMIV